MKEIQHWLLPIFILLVFLGLLLCAKCGIIEAGNYSEMLQALFALLGTIGLLYTLNLQRKTLKSQKKEFKRQAKIQRKEDVKNRFFKMLDYHNEIVSQISVIEYKDKKGRFVSTELHGRQAFVAYKKQLKELYKFVAEITPQNKEKDKREKELNKVIIGVVYIIFHYGFNEEWQDALNFELRTYLYKKKKFGLSSKKIIKKLKKQSKEESAETKNLLRTNQTYLSAYYQNMYNAIKLIDSDDTLEGEKKEYPKEERKARDEEAPKTEKESLISILRAQLSHPELYVLFYSLFWKFGETWDKNNYIEGYEFIKNISKVDLDLDKVKRKYAKHKDGKKVDEVKLRSMSGINPRHYFAAMNYKDNYPEPQKEKGK